MSVQRYERLVEFVERQAGEYFRTAVSFSADDWELLYRRDDLPRERAERRADVIVQGVRGRTPLRKPDSPFGDLDAAIELYENGVFAVVRESPSRGVLLSLERDAARDLASFIHECEEILTTERA